MRDMEWDGNIAYRYRWGDEYDNQHIKSDWVRIDHFENQAIDWEAETATEAASGGREGDATRVLQRLLRQFEREGASRVYVTMGGGEPSAQFLRENGFTINHVTSLDDVRERREADVEGYIDV